MSTFAVKIEQIVDVKPHPNADRLELATILGWQCVVGKDQFKPGDPVVYFPVESILSPEVEAKVFGPDSKVKLSKSRVKTVKIRGAISQGLAVAPDVLALILDKGGSIGLDVTKVTGTKKYEPPVRMTSNSQASPIAKKNKNPAFKEYTGIENGKNYPDMIEKGEEVVVYEKIHGTNFRAGYAPFYADTTWKRIKQFFKLVPKYEFVYGSHRVQLHNKFLYHGYYEKNVYLECVKRYDLLTLLKPGEIIYGEIYGVGVQKGFQYGLVAEDRRLVVFDLMKDGKYVNNGDLVQFCKERRLSMPPVLYTGPFDFDQCKAMADGKSIMSKEQKFREGIVVRPLVERASYAGRAILKFIGDSYYLFQHGGQDEETNEFNH